MKRILVINGHPDPESFNAALAEAYTTAAREAGAEIQQLNLIDLDFQPILTYGYRKRTELEPDLLRALDLIKAADHLVWVFPMWWYGIPALMKGFIDRTFLPGIAFKYVEGNANPRKLLTGTTARIIMTTDTPRWYDRIIMGKPALRQFKKGTLEFCGIKPVKVTYLSIIKDSNPEKREKWLTQVRTLGKSFA